MDGEPIQEPLAAGFVAVGEVDAAAPGVSALAAVGLQCRRCGASVPAGANRCECGCFVSGNQSAVTHGAYRALDRPELRSLIEAERADVLEALGGATELSPQMLRVIQSYAEHAVLRDAALTKVLEAGLVTAKGSVRAIVKVWQSLDETMVKRAQLIGLERRQKQLPNPADWLEGKA